MHRTRCLHRCSLSNSSKKVEEEGTLPGLFCMARITQFQMRLIMISGTQTDNQRTWFQRIMKEGTELLCKHLVIVSGISITNRLMSTYKRCQESEDITTSQLEEQLGQVITMIKLRPDHEATNRHHLSRILY